MCSPFIENRLKQQRVLSVMINCYSVCIVQMFFLVTPSAKNVFYFSFCIIMGDVLHTIPVSNVDLAIFCDRGFGWNKSFGIKIFFRLNRIFPGLQNFSVNRGFIKFIPVGIGYEKKLLFVAPDRQPVPARKIMTPCFQ